MKVLLADATNKQLINHATTVLGLSIPANTTKAGIISKMQDAGFADDGIEVEDVREPEPATLDTGVKVENTAPVVMINPSPTTPAAPNRAMKDPGGAKDPKIKIILQTDVDIGGDRPLPVMVNGVCMLIPRMKECDVPVRYIRVLLNAVKTEYRQDPETLETVGRDVMLHNFTILSGNEHL